MAASRPSLERAKATAEGLNSRGSSEERDGKKKRLTLGYTYGNESCATGRAIPANSITVNRGKRRGIFATSVPWFMILCYRTLRRCQNFELLTKNQNPFCDDGKECGNSPAIHDLVLALSLEMPFLFLQP